MSETPKSLREIAEAAFGAHPGRENSGWEAVVQAVAAHVQTDYKKLTDDLEAHMRVMEVEINRLGAYAARVRAKTIEECAKAARSAPHHGKTPEAAIRALNKGASS